ncbi:MAG: hypothetical protein V4508_00255 [Pseudomonadota bacterium]
MTTETTPLATRRAALIEQCALQRMNAGNAIGALLDPFKGGRMAGGKIVPLMIAGALIGLIATRSARMLPMITAGLSLWKLVRGVLHRPSVE